MNKPYFFRVLGTPFLLCMTRAPFLLEADGACLDGKGFIAKKELIDMINGGLVTVSFDGVKERGCFLEVISHDTAKSTR